MFFVPDEHADNVENGTGLTLVNCKPDLVEY